tara:strand:- start:549 stop:716 length:168 start_codon:yes stop_codon:yes gene_type:complete
MVPLRTIEIRMRKISVFNTAMIDETAVIPVVMANKGTVSFPVARKKTRNTTRKSS